MRGCFVLAFFVCGCGLEGDQDLEFRSAPAETPSEGPAEAEVPLNDEGVPIPVCGDGHRAPAAKVSWEDVPAPVASLPFKVESHHFGELDVEVVAEILAAGNYRRVSLDPRPWKLATASGARRDLSLSEILRELKDEDFVVSGQVVVSAVVTDKAGRTERISGEARFFHPSGDGRFVVYDHNAHRTQYGGGDFRNQLGLPPDPARLGFVDGGQGLPPEVVRVIEQQDPGTPG